MAAAWVMAMGPVARMIAAVFGIVALVVTNWDKIKSATAAVWEWIRNKIKTVGQLLVDLFMNFTLVGIIIKHWDSIKPGTARAWNAIVDWAKGIPQKIVDFFLNWTLVGLIIKHWSAIKDGTVRKAGELVAWVKSLPGRIASGLGNLGSLLFDKGMDLIHGLWNGIKGMGPWLASKLISWAKEMIPGPIARALGIHSPSRLMRDKIGKYIPAGLVAGIEAGAPAIDRTMRSLVSVASAPQFVTAGAAPVNGAPHDVGWGASVHIENRHAGGQSADQVAAALAWQMKGRG
ncbi:hypothetical protein [Streptomyces noursei]|uniref:phage tail protein n=1 Tax=Streptomyces noursei TaxID=1971 RepID=UPI0023B7D1F8|nr:hypothetical protein [Streptomyces noursei]